MTLKATFELIPTRTTTTRNRFRPAFAGKKQDLNSLLGGLMATGAMMSSAMNSICIKKLNPHLTKYQISGGVGFSIILYGFVTVLFEKDMAELVARKENFEFLYNRVSFERSDEFH